MPQRKPEVTRRTAAGIPYELTRKKVKRLNLHIRRDGTVAVSIPWSYTVGFADAFVTEQAQWIREAVSRQLRRNARNDQPLPSKAEARTDLCGGARVLPLPAAQPQPGFLGRGGKAVAGLERTAGFIEINLVIKINRRGSTLGK